MSNWTPVTQQLPPEGATVEAIAPSGDERTLVYASRLWWLPDRSMYVYFVPTHWRAR